MLIRTLKIFLIASAIFIAFCLSGHLANMVAASNHSMIMGSATFSLSFVSIIGAAFKAWYSIFG